MPSFDCTICKRQISYAAADQPHFASHEWECDECYVILGKRRYAVNQAGRNTLFSMMGMALGDRILQSVIREQYAKDNPDENIIHLGYGDPWRAIQDYQPDKFFWANVTSMMTRPDHPCMHWFSLCGEADYYASQGIYPRLDYEPVKPQKFNVQKYIALHIRCINKAIAKNAEPFIVNRIIELCFELYRSKQIEAVVLIGNDQQPVEVYLPQEMIVDLRNGPLLAEIAYVLQNSIVTVGKDSGIIHLAAAAGAKMVSWGYVSKQWMPKAPQDRYTSFMADESHWDAVCQAVREKGGFV